MFWYTSVILSDISKPGLAKKKFGRLSDSLPNIGSAELELFIQHIEMGKYKKKKNYLRIKEMPHF